MTMRRHWMLIAASVALTAVPPGISAQSPVTYPFRGYYCNVTFQRERSGTRTFDLNTDGVAQYGLIPDLLADMQQHGGGPAMRSLFRSAEAYLRMWQLAYAR